MTSAVIKEKNLPPVICIIIEENNLKNLGIDKNIKYYSDKSPFSFDFFIIYKCGKSPTHSPNIPKETNTRAEKSLSPWIKTKTKY